jgi:hypothetical protein
MHGKEFPPAYGGGQYCIGRLEFIACLHVTPVIKVVLRSMNIQEQ